MLDYIAWQPIVSLTTPRRILGHEVLARFQGGLSPAAVFGQADLETAIALDHQCLTAAWTHAPRDGLIFVNVTPAFIRSRSWLWPPNHLRARMIWELPESAGWEPGDIPRWVTVALDDVGAGHAELRRLALVPWRFAKLDRSITAKVASDPEAWQVAQYVVTLAQERQGAVIAEGVESPDWIPGLVEAGVLFGQGWALGYPESQPKRGRLFVWPSKRTQPVVEA